MSRIIKSKPRIIFLIEKNDAEMNNGLETLDTQNL